MKPTLEENQILMRLEGCKTDVLITLYGYNEETGQIDMDYKYDASLQIDPKIIEAEIQETFLRELSVFLNKLENPDA